LKKHDEHEKRLYEQLQSNENVRLIKIKYGMDQISAAKEQEEEGKELMRRKFEEESCVLDRLHENMKKEASIAMERKALKRQLMNDERERKKEAQK